MAKVSLVTGTTSYLARLFIQDSSKTDGSGLTGLAFNTSGLVCYRARDDDGNAGGTAMTLATATRGTWTSIGFVEKDSANLPGVYEFGVPNAALAAGSKSVLIMLKGATNMAPCVLEIELTATNNQDATRGGMTALPNANAEAAGGLYTRGSGAGQINQDANGRIDANAKAWIGGTIPAVNVTGVPLVDAKYLLGTIFSTPATAGIPDINVKNISNAAVSTTSAQVGVNVVNINAQTATAAAGVTFPATIASPTNITAGTITTVSGNVNGSVGSVTAGVTLSTNDSDLVDNGTAQAGASTTITLRSGASATDNIYRGQRVYITSATGVGQSRIITGYVGSTKVATMDEAWQTNPDNTSTYVVKNSRTAKLDSSLQVTAASVQGNVTGSVASVTGAVGSVTGAVGSVTGAVGSVTGAVGSVTGNVGGNVVGSVGSVTGLTASNLDTTVSSRAAPSDVLTQVNSALNAAMTEIASDPGATPTLRQAAQLLYMAVRNKFTNTNSAQQIFNDAGSAIMSNTISDDGVTYSRGKFS